MPPFPPGDAADLLESVKFVPVLGEASIPLPGSPKGAALTVIATPTPRWPDLMVVYDPASKVAFTSKLFSAHVAPSAVSPKVGRRGEGVLGWARRGAGAGGVGGGGGAGEGGMRAAVRGRVACAPAWRRGGGSVRSF